MSLCRTCLRHNLRLLTLSSTAILKTALSPSHSCFSNVPIRRYTAPVTDEIDSSSMASPFDEPERNSYALRNKVEHFLRMENPEAARKLLQRVRMPGSVFAWNLVIRYYGKQRDYPSAYKTYQQMKKCGAGTIHDTYIQLAHALHSTHTLTFKSPSTISSAAVLQLVDHLPSIETWPLHRGTYIFPIIIAKALLSRQTPFSPSEQDEIREKLVEAGRVVWRLMDPFSQETRLEEGNKEIALTHYLLVLSLSSKVSEEDREEMIKLLPLLVQFQTEGSRYSAMRVCQKLKDSDLAITYWKSFEKVPIDMKSATTYLRILSGSKKSREARKILETIISLEKTDREPNPSLFLMALMSCISFVPDVGTALKIHDLGLQYPNVKSNITFNQLLLDSFLRATKSEPAMKRHSPEFIYAIIRKVDMPSLLKQRDRSLNERLQLIETVLELVMWREEIVGGRLDEATRERVRGDRKFYERWREIILKEKKGESTQEEITQMDQEEEERKRTLMESIDDILGKPTSDRPQGQRTRRPRRREVQVDQKHFLESELGESPLGNLRDLKPARRERDTGMGKGREGDELREIKLAFGKPAAKEYSWERELLHGTPVERS